MDYLDLTGMKTIDRDPSAKSVRVWAELTVLGACPHCPNSLFRLKPHGTKSQTLKDAPIRGRTVEIDVKRRRYRCPMCGRTSLQPFAEVDARWGMTTRLVELVERESLLKPFNQVAQETGVAPSTVRAIFREHVARLEREMCFETPRVLGLDGVYIRRKERLVMTDIERRRVVQITTSVKERGVAQALLRLSERRRVEVVTLDMSASLRRAVLHALPWAVIVVDRFHIQRMANQAVDRVRRRIHTGMTRYDRRLVMRDPRLLRKHRDQLKKMGKLDVVEEWLDCLPELRAAYDLKETFFEVWHSSCSISAWRRYEAWERSVPGELRGREAFGPLLTAVVNWGDEIFNFFDHRFTNAYTESANNLIKTVQREGGAATSRPLGRRCSTAVPSGGRGDRMTRRRTTSHARRRSSAAPVRTWAVFRVTRPRQEARGGKGVRIRTPVSKPEGCRSRGAGAAFEATTVKSNDSGSPPLGRLVYSSAHRLLG